MAKRWEEWVVEQSRAAANASRPHDSKVLSAWRFCIAAEAMRLKRQCICLAPWLGTCRVGRIKICAKSSKSSYVTMHCASCNGLGKENAVWHSLLFADGACCSVQHSSCIWTPSGPDTVEKP
ncbi:hypothetical protein CBR_g38092 [Chara braunii]|uniref:Uncharacterized protein n=1 Tax=Chara braunii TaxID=69332 RepID=A0A388K088_CHABU|nr:hypothetical protein CBR_g38092 [Chara braunii]|eukprot:GBG63474.1 hypothetical protein CBR_g38092 [Chara braunii]